MKQETRREAPYLADREADVVLRDGSTLHVRPVLQSDEGGLLDLLQGLSSEAVSFRFFSGGPNLRQMARWAVDVDYNDRYGLVATTGPKERIVAHAAFVRLDDDRAEVAFEIADELQGRGLGTILYAHLAEAAEERGITTFEAEVLPENKRMLEVFRDSGFPVTTGLSRESFVVASPTALSAEAVERFEQRDQIAALNAMQHFLAPTLGSGDRCLP